MRVVLQRVDHASVDVGDDRIASIAQGLLLLVGITNGDETVDLARTARRIVDLRIFEDDQEKMNRSLRDIGGEILAVSQFTLYADTRKGRRPSFVGAAGPDVALPLFDRFVACLRDEGVDVQTGEFGAKMDVRLCNSGPVTILLEVEPAADSG